MTEIGVIRYKKMFGEYEQDARIVELALTKAALAHAARRQEKEDFVYFDSDQFTVTYY